MSPKNEAESEVGLASCRPSKGVPAVAFRRGSLCIGFGPTVESTRKNQAPILFLPGSLDKLESCDLVRDQ